MVDVGAFLTGHPTRSTLRSVWREAVGDASTDESHECCSHAGPRRSRKYLLRYMPSGLDQSRGILLLEVLCRLIFLGKEAPKSYSVSISTLATWWSGAAHGMPTNQAKFHRETKYTQPMLQMPNASHRSSQAFLEGVASKESSPMVQSQTAISSAIRAI